MRTKTKSFPSQITARERIDGVEYLVVLEQDCTGRYREVDMVPMNNRATDHASAYADG